MRLTTDALERHAATIPGKPFLVCGNVTVTYGQLHEHAARTAEWLSARGVRPGERVILTVGARDPWFASIYLGTHRAGAIAVPVSDKLPPAAREAIREQVAPALEIAGDALEDLKQFAAAGATHAGPARAEVSPDDVADILFTSGTTGRPKGVVLTHASIMAAARNINAFIGNSADDREVVTVPLSHSFGLGRLRCNLLAGGTVILVPGLSFPALVFRALEEHAATGLACVPTGAAVLLKWDADRLGRCAQHLRYAELGSSPMPMPLKERLMSLLPNTRICMHYGLTEASRSAFIEFHADRAKLASVGRPSPNVSIQVCDEAGGALPPDVVGRIRIRAATVLKEYWRDPDLTRGVLNEEGWFHTGDLGHFDAEGFLYFDGREDDQINVGGRKVSPAVIEEAAAAHPDVLEAACVGMADPAGLLGEVPVLCVVLRDALAELPEGLLAFVSTRVEAHAVPARIEVVKALPKTPAGKLQRSVLRTQLAQPVADGR